jgi:membrane protein implicated in regulation of membrane protease activity
MPSAEDILDSNRDRINNIKERRNDKVAWWVPISLIIFAIISFLAIWYLKRRDRLRGPREEELERLRQRAEEEARAMGRSFNDRRNQEAAKTGGLIWRWEQGRRPPFYYDYRGPD